VVDAPHGALFDGAPTIKATRQGEGSATLTLRFGKNVRLGRGMTLEVWALGDNLLEAGDDVTFLNDVRISLRSGSVRFGPNSIVRDGVLIKSNGNLHAGRKVTIGHHAAVHCHGEVILEDLAGTGERVSVIDSEHAFEPDDVHYTDKPVKVTPVRIGRNTMLAINAVVLRGADIGRNSVVAANAVVREGKYPDASVLAGSPAKVVKTFDSGERDDSVLRPADEPAARESR
jgi:acetyltransferase-like isoleucine patch superfamily enzyme